MTNTRQAGEAVAVYRPWTPGCTALLRSIAADANMAEWASNPTMPEFLSSAADALSDLDKVSRERDEAVRLLREARPFVADDTEATVDIADRIDAVLNTISIPAPKGGSGGQAAQGSASQGSVR